MPEDRSKLVDELGVIQKRLAPFAADLAREKAIKATIRTWPAADGTASDSSVLYSGRKYALTLGPCEHERKIRSMTEVFKLVGKAKFVQHCKLTLKALEELVTATPVADLLVTERTGPRTLTIAERTS